ncbi:conserved hypothetical protein [Acinetobacter proteolyticus]|jgi:hypothetical protein|uniref:Uncharacterized protein n=2 Tax=Acinetobacter proteolyticus TaxID=1776741 RepID=A0A653K3N8_9GAMM|nr:conserved hypothetical protein [Acinetobacter proteolyticus]
MMDRSVEDIHSAMDKDFKSETYTVDESITDTILWLMQHQDIFDSFHFDVHSQELSVTHAAGVDIIRVGMFLNAKYGILVTSI